MIITNYLDREYFTRNIQTKLGNEVIKRYMIYFNFDFKIKEPNNFQSLFIGEEVELKFVNVGNRLDYITIESYLDN